MPEASCLWVLVLSTLLAKTLAASGEPRLTLHSLWLRSEWVWELSTESAH